MSLGKVKRKLEKEVELLDRKIIVWIKEFESGIQRVGAFFADKNPIFLTKQNIELRKKIKELEDKLNDKS